MVLQIKNFSSFSSSKKKKKKREKYKHFWEQKRISVERLKTEIVFCYKFWRSVMTEKNQNNFFFLLFLFSLFPSSSHFKNQKEKNTWKKNIVL